MRDLECDSWEGGDGVRGIVRGTGSVSDPESVLC